jgi:hypothetical protein
MSKSVFSFELSQSLREASTLARISVEYNWNKLDLNQPKTRTISAHQIVPYFFIKLAKADCSLSPITLFARSTPIGLLRHFYH